MAAFFFALSNLLFWWIGKHSCTSYIETWMGLTPMEVRIAYHSGGAGGGGTAGLRRHNGGTAGWLLLLAMVLSGRAPG